MWSEQEVTRGRSKRLPCRDEGQFPIHLETKAVASARNWEATMHRPIWVDRLMVPAPIIEKHRQR